MSSLNTGVDLKRTIGVFGLACAVVNITIGTGIFVLPALVAEHLGAVAIICFLICGVLIFLIALCFAEVGSKVTGSGGTYAYIETAFGPFSGFLANNIFWQNRFYPPIVIILRLLISSAWICSKSGVNCPPNSLAFD